LVKSFIQRLSELQTYISKRKKNFLEINFMLIYKIDFDLVILFAKIF